MKSLENKIFLSTVVFGRLISVSKVELLWRAKLERGVVSKLEVPVSNKAEREQKCWHLMKVCVVNKVFLFAMNILRALTFRS